MSSSPLESGAAPGRRAKSDNPLAEVGGSVPFSRILSAGVAPCIQPRRLEAAAPPGQRQDVPRATRMASKACDDLPRVIAPPYIPAVFWYVWRTEKRTLSLKPHVYSTPQRGH